MTDATTEKIRDFLSSTDIRTKVEDSETLQSIRDGFGDAFANVKGRLGDSWEDVQTLYHMAFDDTFEMKKEVKYAVVGALAYLVSPIDLIPDRAMGALGLADDVAVLLFALKFARPEIDRYRGHQAAFEPDAHQRDSTPDVV